MKMIRLGMVSNSCKDDGESFFPYWIIFQYVPVSFTPNVTVLKWIVLFLKPFSLIMSLMLFLSAIFIKLKLALRKCHLCNEVKHQYNGFTLLMLDCVEINFRGNCRDIFREKCRGVFSGNCRDIFRGNCRDIFRGHCFK